MKTSVGGSKVHPAKDPGFLIQFSAFWSSDFKVLNLLTAFARIRSIPIVSDPDAGKHLSLLQSINRLHHVPDVPGQRAHLPHAPLRQGLAASQMTCIRSRPGHPLGATGLEPAVVWVLTKTSAPGGLLVRGAAPLAGGPGFGRNDQRLVGLVTRIVV